MPLPLRFRGRPIDDHHRVRRRSAASSGANGFVQLRESRYAEDQHLIGRFLQLPLQFVGRGAETQLCAHLKTMHRLRFRARIEQRAHAERALRVAAAFRKNADVHASADTWRSRLAATASVERRDSVVGPMNQHALRRRSHAQAAPAPRPRRCAAATRSAQPYSAARCDHRDAGTPTLALGAGVDERGLDALRDARLHAACQLDQQRMLSEDLDAVPVRSAQAV